jgi:hypothetical protein
MQRAGMALVACAFLASCASLMASLSTRSSATVRPTATPTLPPMPHDLVAFSGSGMSESKRFTIDGEGAEVSVVWASQLPGSGSCRFGMRLWRSAEGVAGEDLVWEMGMASRR